MAASKRRRRIKIPIEFLRFVVVCVAFSLVYLAVLILHARMLSPSSGSNGNSSANTESSGSGDSGGSGSNKQSEPPEAKPRHPQEETPPPTHLSYFSEVYSERERALLGDDVSNTGLEAVKHTGEWKSAADWDQDFVRMNQTFNLSMDPPLPSTPTAFQPLEVPTVKLPALSICCAAR